MPGIADRNDWTEQCSQSFRHPAPSYDGNGNVRFHAFFDAGHSSIVAWNLSQKANRSWSSSRRLLAFSRNPSLFGAPAIWFAWPNSGEVMLPMMGPGLL